jgi:hypothetical protein
VLGSDLDRKIGNACLTRRAMQCNASDQFVGSSLSYGRLFYHFLARRRCNEVTAEINRPRRSIP